MDKIKSFKNTMAKKDREDRAQTLYKKIVEYARNIRVNTVMFSIAMKQARDDELFQENPYSCKSFDLFCCLPEIGIKPATVKKYIKIIEFYQEKEIELTVIVDIPINHLDVMRNAKDPAKWIEPAKQLAFSDFRKEIYEKELGVKPDDKEIEQYIKRNEKKKDEGCGHWINGECDLGRL